MSSIKSIVSKYHKITELNTAVTWIRMSFIKSIVSNAYKVMNDFFFFNFAWTMKWRYVIKSSEKPSGIYGIS